MSLSAFTFSMPVALYTHGTVAAQIINTRQTPTSLSATRSLNTDETTKLADVVFPWATTFRESVSGNVVFN
ncbi:hypothetical protein [Endozoicomonas atrinae]|uniref:hypothetical protein n=1 Tax=Endozoicomonas atrinae TaxID=1333660 RepID=UPI000AB62B28|nr:hypothetical protein [Endozoicomonas atrinae]